MSCAQEPPGSPVRADSGRYFARAEDSAAVDDGRDDGAVVAVDHPVQAEFGQRRFVELVYLLVESGRVDDDQVGASAFAQVTGVDLIPVGELAGEAVDGTFQAQERLAGFLGAQHSFEQT